jgi:putative acetyltransferase
MDIRLDDLKGPEIVGLLEEHVRSLRAISPPESCHVLDLAGLRRPEITFWSAWQGSQLLGCAALKELDRQHGEIKSMRTASLETGAQAEFEPALRLYTGFGFERCRPFGNYVEDPLSVFMTRAL